MKEKACYTIFEKSAMNRTALFSKDTELAKANEKETEYKIMNQQSSKLQAKDLITVGIFTAICFVIFLLDFFELR